MLITTRVRTAAALMVLGLCARAAHAQADGASGAQAAAPVRPDSVRPFLVFAPIGESWFVAASRGKRMLLDIGRVDLEVRKDSAVAAAFREAVAAASPIRPGATFRVRAPWGTEEARAVSFDSWNGRIVMVLQGSAVMDSAVQGRAPVTASAQRLADGSTPSAAAIEPPLARTPRGTAPCVRPALDGDFGLRVTAIKDSLEAELRALPGPIYERLIKRVTANSSRVSGCFGGAARAILAVSLRANGAEWVREKVVMVDSLGRASALGIDDFRFRAHDLLHAVDADGDGVDDVAAIGRTFRAGGTTLLRFDLQRKKLVRIAAGFVWEDL